MQNSAAGLQQQLCAFGTPPDRRSTTLRALPEAGCGSGPGRDGTETAQSTPAQLSGPLRSAVAPLQPPGGPHPLVSGRRQPTPRDPAGVVLNPHPHISEQPGRHAPSPAAVRQRVLLRGASHLLILSAKARRSALGSVAMARRRLAGL